MNYFGGFTGTATMQSNINIHFSLSHSGPTQPLVYSLSLLLSHISWLMYWLIQSGWRVLICQRLQQLYDYILFGAESLQCFAHSVLRGTDLLQSGQHKHVPLLAFLLPSLILATAASFPGETWWPHLSPEAIISLCFGVLSVWDWGLEGVILRQ